MVEAVTHDDPHYHEQGNCICWCADCVVNVGAATWAKTCRGRL